MKKIFYLLTAASLLFMGSCGKDGAPGMDGKDGIQGEQGIPGVDGATLLSGDGAPANVLGKDGDFYLDKTTVSIYGPKTTAGWGKGTELKGKDGQDGKDGRNGVDGKDGSKILNGTAVPEASLGALGDFYFDTQNMAIYGPKNANGWGNPMSLRVPDGSGVTVLLYKNQHIQKVERGIDREYVLETIIPIDSRYQYVYDNGIILVQFRKPNDALVKWTEDEMEYEGDDNQYMRVRIGDDFEVGAYKEYVKIIGDAQGYTEAEIKAIAFDVKIVFIPATTVIEMKTQHIDTKNTRAVVKHLGL